MLRTLGNKAASVLLASACSALRTVQSAPPVSRLHVGRRFPVAGAPLNQRRPVVVPEIRAQRD